MSTTPEQRNRSWLLANLLRRPPLPNVLGAPAQAAPAPAAAPPQMSAMVDLSDFNNPPPQQAMPPSLDDFNAQPSAPLPLPPQYAPPPVARASAGGMGGGMGADDLNAISLALAQGGQMPAGADQSIWARMAGIYGR